MGSLMAGWDSPVPDPKSIQLQRNRSMTKEDIATYWRSKKNVVEEGHGVLKTSYTFSEKDQKNKTEKVYTRSNSLPATTENSAIETSQEEEDDKENQEKLFQKHGWWINSRWAFLNEPPVIASETPFRYAAQFHVAKKHIDDSNNHAASNGIRT